MEYRESLEIVLRDCRFVIDEGALKSLLPGVVEYLPPLSAIRFSDGGVPRFIWGFPIVHGRRLLWSLHQFLLRETLRGLSDAAYQENLRLLTPTELKEEPYFQALSDCLLKALAEGSFLRLDSVLWIYLADVICRRLNQDEAIDRIIEEINADQHVKTRRIDPELIRLRFRAQERYVELRTRVLRSLFARNDFANSCMKDVYDEVPNNPLNREMIANRLVYTERDEPIYRSLELGEAFLAKGYKLVATDFSAINRSLRLVISGILQRGELGQLLPLDHFFLKQFVTDGARQKATGLSPQGQGFVERPLSPREAQLAEEREKLAMLLSLQEEPARYLLTLLVDADKEYFRPIERQGSIPKELLKSLRHRPTTLIYEQIYTEISRDLLRWDFFNALKARIRWVSREQDTLLVDSRPLDRATVPVNLDSIYEMYRRGRYGTAVFFDLVGFTDRTKALTRELQEAAQRGDKERYSLASISIAIQRVFQVRNHLEHYGGIPQGFEGDAILDVFPRAFDALRYVTAFADNYNKNRAIRFRPFERPTENPYRDGFRVGICSGEYSLISIVGRSNDLLADEATERAVGHTINRASRLNSGKKGKDIFLADEEGEAEAEVHDPLNLFRVVVSSDQQLNNDGIASFEETFQEIRETVKRDKLPWYEPPSRQGGRVGGVLPHFRNYVFDFIFEDPQARRIYLIRRLHRRPVLKGLEDEQCAIFEYILVEPDALPDLLRRDAAIVPPPPRLPPEREPVVAPPPVRALDVDLDPADELSSLRPVLSGTLAAAGLSWRDMVDEEAFALHLQHGLSSSVLASGREGVARAIEQHDRALSELARSQAGVSEAGPQPSTIGRLERLELSVWEGDDDEPAPDARQVQEIQRIQQELRADASAFLQTRQGLAASLGESEDEGAEIRPMPAGTPQQEARWLAAVSHLRAERSSAESLDAEGENPDSTETAVQTSVALFTELSRPSSVREAVGSIFPEPDASDVPEPAFSERPLSPPAEVAYSPGPSAEPQPLVSASEEWSELEAAEADEEVLEIASLEEGATLRISWDSTPELRALLAELAPERLAGEGGLLKRGTGQARVLADRLAGYRYALLPSGEPAPAARVILGRIEGDFLQDLHVFDAASLVHEPWNLEPAFSALVESVSLRQPGQRTASLPLEPSLQSLLRPVPVAFLERLCSQHLAKRGLSG